MKRTLSFGLLLLSLACFPALSEGDDKKPDTSAASFTSVGDVSGILQKVDSGSITLRLTGVTLQGGGRGRSPQAKENHQDLKLELTPDYKVRILHLPPLTDDKGKPKQRSPEELQKLKGNSNLPGYTAEPDDLKPNQVVQVHLVKMRGAGADAKSFVSRIIIVSESNVAAQNEKKKDKN